MFDWKPDVPWLDEVERVLTYFADRPKLKYGPENEDKAFPLIDDLCSKDCLTQAEAMQNHSLTMDGVMTILSNVTMAIQGGNSVWSPEMGGWYTTIKIPKYAYVVAPGFRAAWIGQQGKL